VENSWKKKSVKKIFSACSSSMKQEILH